MTLRHRRAAAALAGLLIAAACAASSVRAAPVPEGERGPVDVRRTTLVVRSIDRALAFYRDALGLRLVYDQEIVRPPRPGIGDVILVINAADLDQRFERVRNVPGVSVASEPQLTTYPAPDGQGTIPVRVSAVWDPDGYFIELNQLLGTAAGTATR